MKESEGQKVNLLESNDNEIITGEISPKCLVQLDKMMNTTYQPMFNLMDHSDWGQCDNEMKEEFLHIVSKFSSEVQDSI